MVLTRPVAGTVGGAAPLGLASQGADRGAIVARHSAGAVADGTEDAPLTCATPFRNREEAEAVSL